MMREIIRSNINRISCYRRNEEQTRRLDNQLGIHATRMTNMAVELPTRWHCWHAIRQYSHIICNGKSHKAWLLNKIAELS